MYKVAQVAKMLGISRQAVYKKLNYAEQSKGLKVYDVENCCKVVTEEGLKYLQPGTTSELKATLTLGLSQDDIVKSLLLQLEIKDKQLQSKDEQISALLEQSKNYQLLLRAEQERQLLSTSETIKKPSILGLLFNRNKN